MSNEENEFDFENQILSFKSNVNDFTKSIFNDLDSISKDIESSTRGDLRRQNIKLWD